MATSPARHERRKTQRRKQKAAGLVAAGAATAMLAGTAIAPPADAAPLLPLSIGSIADIPGLNAVAAACNAGDSPADTALGATADCTNATPWLLTPIADGVLGLFAPDLMELISIGGLNGALATAGPEGNVSIWPLNASVHIPGSASISGSGYTTAITLLGGQSSAKADYLLAAAVAIAATGGIANADALFGVAAASAIGRPATQVGIIPGWSVGSPRVENTAKARALPLGIAIANSSLKPSELLTGALQNVPQYRTSTTALGGITAAYRSVDGSKGAVCTAAYGEARVHEETLDDDGDVISSKRTNSCTSVLFIFQKQQNEDKHGGFEVYAIKNPLDIGLVSPYGDNIAALLAGIGGGIIDLGPLNDVLAGKFVPEFQSDIIRLVMDPSGPKIETDLLEWLEGLFEDLDLGNLASSPLANLSGLNPNAVSQALGSSATESSAAADDQPSVHSALADTGAGDAPTAQRAVNTFRGDVTVTDAPEVKEQNLPPLEVATQTPPPAPEPVVTPPAPEPIVTAPAPAPEPIVTAPAPEPVVETPPAVETVTPPAAADSVDLVPAG